MLKDEERAQLHDVLLAAFQSEEDLAAMVQKHLREILGDIAAGDDYSEVVYRLIDWAQDRGRTGALIKAAIGAKPKDFCLLGFDYEYRRRRIIGFRDAFTPEMRGKLVNVLIRVPVVATPETRAALLIGIPGVSALNRSSANPQVDLNLLLGGLNDLGPLQYGGWPLLIFIDNALSFIDDALALKQEIVEVREALARGYGEA